MKPNLIVKMPKILLLDQRRILEDLENFEPCHRYNTNNYNQSCGNRDMSKLQCFDCNVFGDYKRDCPKDPKSKKNTKRKEISEYYISKYEEARKSKIEDNKDLYY